MAHWAELNENNIVLRVTVGDNNAPNEGYDWIMENLGGRWIQTSYNNNFRKQYAGIGFYYDEDADVFIGLQPFPSWILDENYDWQAPVARPEDSEEGFWVWNEDVVNWEFINFEGV